VACLMGVHGAQEAAFAGLRVGVVAHARPPVGKDLRPAVRVREDLDPERTAVRNGSQEDGKGAPLPRAAPFRMPMWQCCRFLPDRSLG
jgi:hypothetical protein